ncbi:MAG TPA: DUF2975 domain-containing protein [Chitinophagaceae bacterium]|nr:DUF2975 domain-containing protein [Chitinophagaceae bacterium]
MKSVRIVANILYYLTRVAAMLYLITAVYCLGVVILGGPINIKDGGFLIYYPFTTTTFLLGDYNSAYLTMMISIISFYGVFLWLLSNVFNTFRQSKLFTSKSVMRLSRFYITNLTVPVISLIAALLFYHDAVSDVLMITFLHLVIGIFAFFMAAIFRQGLVLQEEQDLTL